LSRVHYPANHSSTTKQPLASAPREDRDAPCPSYSLEHLPDCETVRDLRIGGESQYLKPLASDDLPTRNDEEKLFPPITCDHQHLVTVMMQRITGIEGNVASPKGLEHVAIMPLR
jgi:hypothetical protein